MSILVNKFSLFSSFATLGTAMVCASYYLIDNDKSVSFSFDVKKIEVYELQNLLKYCTSLSPCDIKRFDDYILNIDKINKKHKKLFTKYNKLGRLDCIGRIQEKNDIDSLEKEKQDLIHNLLINLLNLYKIENMKICDFIDKGFVHNSEEDYLFKDTQKKFSDIMSKFKEYEQTELIEKSLFEKSIILLSFKIILSLLSYNLLFITKSELTKKLGKELEQKDKNKYCKVLLYYSNIFNNLFEKKYSFLYEIFLKQNDNNDKEFLIEITQNINNYINSYEDFTI